MKLNNLVMRGGVLVVLLSLLVVGCKGMGGGDTESLTVDTNKEKRWEGKNTSTTEYVRYYKQFGSSDKVTEATIEITAQYPENGWSGFVFGLEKNAQDNTKSDFYVLGIKTSNKVPYYYLSKFEGVNPDEVAASKATTLPGETEIIRSTRVPEGIVASTSPLKVYVKFTLEKGESGNSYKLMAGSREATLFDIGEPILTRATGCGIGAYGQLTTAKTEGTAIVSDTTIKVLSSKPSNLLAAEDAE
ncbi:MAG: hypothetical protein IJX45_11215 [Spirochaetaceae bacterium]|nr:hypothetical protein [Spirochaetaceae bacterium]